MVTLVRAALSRAKVLTGKPKGTEVAAWKGGDVNWEAAGMKCSTRKK